MFKTMNYGIRNLNRESTSGSAGLATRTTGGLFWMLLASALAKGGSFVAQIFLGWLLLKEDFGIYAIAISIASLVQVLKDGGTRKILMQRGVKRFERLCPAVFWMSLCFNTAIGIILAGVSYPAALLYDEPRLTVLLLILALASLLGTPDSMYRAWLSVRLQFRDLAQNQAIQGLVQSGGMIVLAWAGAGATSFVWPIVVQVVLGWFLGYRVCGSLPIRGRIRWRIWPALLSASLWLFIGSSAMLMLKQGPYMILGLFHDPVLIGVYFFAFQLLIQINQLVALNFQSVLLPALSSVQRNINRHVRAVLRTSQALVVVSTLMAMCVGVGIHDVIRLIWGEKWVDAIPAVQWMALFFPFRMFQSVFEPALLSRGMYRVWAWLMVLQAVIVIIATICASFVASSAGGFALWIGIGFMCSMFGATWIGMRRLGVPLYDLLIRTIPPYVVGATVYGSMLLVRESVGFNRPAESLKLVQQGMLTCTAFAVSYIVVLRLFMPGSLFTLCESLPGRAGRAGRKVMILSNYTKQSD